MTKHRKEILMTLSNEQLIYIIEQMYHSLFMISEVCIDASKGHITSRDALRRIRENIYTLPCAYNEAEFKGFIDMKMGKITPEEYRKICLED